MRKVILIPAAFGLLALLGYYGGGDHNKISADKIETYRLVQAIGNIEHIDAKGLSEAECRNRQKDLKIVAAALSGGSVACLPEKYFDN